MGNYNQAQPPEHAFCDVDDPGQEGMLVVQLYLQPAMFLGVLILGLPLNLISLWIFSHRLRRWTRSSVLLFNLALADTSWLLALPFLIYFHLNDLRWNLGPSVCKALRLLYHNYFYLSIFFVTCVSVDRYLAIVHPLRSLVLLGRRQTYLLCVAVWAVTMVLSLPVAYLTWTPQCPQGNRTICTLYMLLDNPVASLPFSLICSCIGFLFPLVAICYCCLCCVKELRSRPRLPRPHNSKHRLTRILSAVLILFALFYMPYHLARNAAIFMRVVYPGNPPAWQAIDLVFSLEICICSLNTCINPLFSCFVGSQFRKELQDTFAGLCHHRPGVVTGATVLHEREQRNTVHGMATVTPLPWPV